jgi:hypothetical protein
MASATTEKPIFILPSCDANCAKFTTARPQSVQVMYQRALEHFPAYIV